ncbi:DUF2948 family protein [Acuticoccus sediminis]|uniref:DUF2948 family protein n=1 Tax=Acuticoccus sediminis TaxID=2184697 RepID=UPI001CFE323A|nr:DUF2948 family protein [Acuticoccus sediminis]
MTPSPHPVKMFALDDEDLTVVSAHVQDAVAKVADIRWSPADGHFAIPMNRFAWELTADRKSRRRGDERRRAVLSFARVKRAQVTGVAPGDKETVLSILAVVFEEGETPAGTISIVCSGDVMIRLEVECIEAQLTDLGGAWSASMRPKHAVGR